MIRTRMPSLTATQVRHIAKLARLSLSDDEVERFTKELTSILAYVDALQKRLGAEGYAISIDAVPYEFQRGGNQMMRIRAL